MPGRTPTIVAVALNPAIDRAIEVPGLCVGGHLRGRLLSIQPAGKAVNVARLLGTLDTRCVLTGFVGEADRDRFERSFEKMPVRVEMFDVPGATRENITLVDPDRGVETHVRDVGFAVSPDDVQRLRKKLHILAGKGNIVVFAGSLNPGLDAAAFADLLDVCRRRGASVAVDTSGPGLEAVRKARGLWLVKPNQVELSELAGRPVDGDAAVRAAAESLRGRVDRVVVTLGADGALLFCREGVWRARPNAEPDAVITTVGSGDALLAGFIHAHALGKPPADCLRWGVACGTAATLQLKTGEVNPYDVQACLERVEVKAVKA
jgi:1-phosphofructokinase family hexose kinase